MKINPITTNEYTHKTAFKGTVDKEIVSMIDRGISNTLRNLTEEASKNHQRLEPEKIIDLKNLRDRALYTLMNYMKKTHPNTVLKTNGKNLFFENTKINTSLEFLKRDNPLNNNYKEHFRKSMIDISDPTTSLQKTQAGYIDNSKLTSYVAFILERFAKDLEHYIEPKKVDKMLFEQFTNRLERKAKSQDLLGKFRAMLNGKKADSLAPEFGAQEGNWIQKLVKINKDAAKEHKIRNDINIENIALIKKIFQ